MIKKIIAFRESSPIIFKTTLLVLLLIFSSPLGHLISYVQHLGNKPAYEDYVSQREEYSEEFKEYVHHMLPEAPKNEEETIINQVLSGMLQVTTAGADNLTDAIGWAADLTIGNLDSARNYVADWWWNFKISIWAWMYGFILYFIAFSLMVDILTSGVNRKILQSINKLFNTNFNLDSFWFGLIMAGILYLTPFSDYLDSGFDLIHYLTHDLLV